MEVYCCCRQSYLNDLLLLLDFFLIGPGHGEEFVYSQVDVNATLNCTVNSTKLKWTVDDLNFAEFGAVLHSRGIFQSQQSCTNGITGSVIIIIGDIDINNNTRVCCRSLVGVVLLETCTTLIIYGMISYFAL